MPNKTNKKTREDIVLDRITYNIEGIYRNEKIKSHILHLREIFKIPKNLYKNDKDDFDKKTTLDELLDERYKIWMDSVPEDGPVIQEICKNLSLLFTEYSKVKDEAQAMKLSYPTKKNYAVDHLRNFIDGRSIIYHLMKRNSEVWKKVISARLLYIPLKIVIENKQDILEDYLPKVNDNLTIQLHEASGMEDFALIKDKIKEKKNGYKNKYGWKTNLDKNDLYRRNKKAYELRILEKKSYKETRLYLKDKMPGLMPEECEDSYINKMVKSHIAYTDDIENTE